MCTLLGFYFFKIYEKKVVELSYFPAEYCIYDTPFFGIGRVYQFKDDKCIMDTVHIK